jgi:carbonic anhydrase/acetyltransferase-like protein (isoleucine patch superfamily)
MTVYTISGWQPKLADDAWIAPNATVIGQVELARASSVWFGAVLRGDTDWIKIGEESNVQDLSVIHADAGVPTIVGDRVTIGHKVMLHGCTVEDDCLIGIGAIILNGARIGRGSIIGAGALIPQGKVIPPGSMVMGAPGKVVRELSAPELEMVLFSAAHYAANAQRFRKELVEIPR